MFDKKMKEKIISVLNSKKVNAKCPMCGEQKFILADNYIRNDLQENLKSVNLGGPSIPSVAIVCGNCGFISLHAIGPLGLMPKDEGGQ